MESYIRSVLNEHDKSGKIFQLNHHTTFVIFYGRREQVVRQGLKDVSVKIYLNTKSNYLNIDINMHICYVVQVNFEAFDGVITFLNISDIHWKFVVSDATYF